MAGLIDAITNHSTGNPGLGDLGAVAGKLGTVIETLRTLPDQPATAVENLLKEVGELPVPEMQAASKIGQGLAKLADNLPTDFSGITDAFAPVLEKLAETVGGDVAPALRDFVDLIQAVKQLAEYDFQGAFAPEDKTGAPDSPAPAPGPGAGPAPAPAPAPGSGSSPGPGAGPGAPGPGAGPAALVAPDPAVAKARQARLDSISAARAGLSVFPSPLNAPNLVIFLEDVLAGIPRDNVAVRKLPFFDEASQLLTTVKNMRGMDDAALLAHFKSSLEGLAGFLEGTFAGFLDAYAADAQTAVAFYKLPALKSDLDALQSALGPVATAVEGGSLAGQAAALADAATALDRILPALALIHSPGNDAYLAQLGQRARRLPVEMERQMKQLLSVAEPANGFRFLARLSGPLKDFLAKDPGAQVAADFKAALAVPLRLLDAVESSGLKQALQAPTQAVEAVLAQMDAVTGQVATGAAGIFGAVNGVLDEIDPEALLAALRKAVADFREAVEAKIKALFQPIVMVITNALAALKAATDAFDPAAVTAALEEFLDQLADLVDNDQVNGALDTLRAGMDQASQAIQGLHFSTVTDAVEDGIQQVIDILGMIDPALLPDEAKNKMKEAVAAFPPDLDAPVQEITAGFDEIVDAGPKALLAFLSAKAKEIKAALDKFKPSELVGDALSDPFKDVISALEEFHPASLFDPVRAALDGIRDDLLARLDPRPLLAPLQPQFDALKRQMDGIDPQALLKPVEDAVSQGAQALRDALPLDELIGALSFVLDKIGYAIGLATEFRLSLEKLLEVLGALGNAEQQLRAWIQSILTRAAALSDVSSLQPAVAAISAAVNGSKAAALTARFDAARAALKAPIDSLAPAAALEAAANLRRRFRPDRVAALPASAEKTALAALLLRFEPLAPGYADPLQALDRLARACADSALDWSATMSRWDARHHRAGGPLDRIGSPVITAAQLRDMLARSLEDEFVVPIGGLFGLIDDAVKLVRAPFQEILAFLQSVETRAAALLTGPDTLGGLVTALKGLADRISGFDIGFLGRELGATYDSLKAKVAALDPGHVGTALRADLETALGILSVDTLLPPTLLPELDALVAKTAADLKLLDPKVIVEKTLDPIWNGRIKPQVEKLDFSPLLDALLAKLESLKEELGEELGDVNVKYQALLAAIPSGSGTPAATASVGV